MYVAPPPSWTQAGFGVLEPHALASKNQNVESVVATACICVGLLNGASSLSKQWLAPQNHGRCGEAAVSLRSVPVHRRTKPRSLNTICATADMALRNAPLPFSDEHGTSTLQDPASPISISRLPDARSAGLRKKWP